MARFCHFARRIATAFFELDLAHRLAILLALGCIVLFLFNSLERVGKFSPDGMNYVDVARNIVAGRGITQSTIGFNQPYFPVDDDIPTPLTIHPPLYPLAIATLIRLGFDAPPAALVASWVGYVAILACAYLLIQALYNRYVAIFCSAALLTYAPLVMYARFALSDTMRLALLLAGLVVIVRDSKETGITWRPVVAGSLFGLGFATSYALAPTLVLGAVGLLISGYRRKDQFRARVLRVSLFLAGFLIPAATVLARNYILTGRLTGSQTLPIALMPNESFSVIIHTFSSSYLGDSLPGKIQQVLLGVTLLVTCLLFVWRRKFFATVKHVFISEDRYILSLWALLYVGFVVYGRSRTFFDLDERTLLPAGVILVMLVSALAGAVAGQREKYLGFGALLLLCVALGREITIASGRVSPTSEQTIAGSGRLRWIATQTTDRDLITGVDTYDVPFYVRRQGVLCFHGLPFGQHAEYGMLMTWIERNRSQYDRFFFVLPAYHLALDEWSRRYGPFIADLVTEKLDAYPAIRTHVRLADAYIFELQLEDAQGRASGDSRRRAP